MARRMCRAQVGHALSGCDGLGLGLLKQMNTSPHLAGSAAFCCNVPTGGCDHHALLEKSSVVTRSWIASKMRSWQVRDVLNYTIYAW